MDIILWHRRRGIGEGDILSRAAARGRMRRKAVWWDIAFVLLLAVIPVVWAMLPGLRGVPLLACLLPVRVSVWELEKLLFWPTALIAMLRWIFTGELVRGIVTRYAAALLPAMALLLAGTYTAVGMVGTSLPALAAAYAPAAVLLVWRSVRGTHRSNVPGTLVLLLLAACFVWMTGHAPDMAIFRAL